VPLPTPALRWQVEEGAAQDVAGGMLGTAEDASVKVFVVARVSFQRRNQRPTHTCHPHAAFRRHVKDEHLKGVTQDMANVVAEDIPQGISQDLAFGARATCTLLATPPPPPPLSLLRSSRLAEMGAQLGSSVAFGSRCGQALPGVSRKGSVRDLALRNALCFCKPGPRCLLLANCI